MPVQWLALLALASILACGARDPAHSTSPERFTLEAAITDLGPRLFRFDTATGDVWVARLVGPRSWELLGAEMASLPGPGSVAGRYRLQVIRAKSTPLTLLRLESQTGQVWRLAVAEDERWLIYQDDY